jgi:uncharacterized integral membrane protein
MNTAPSKRGVTVQWWQVASVVILAVALIFVFQNRGLTAIRVLVPVIVMPLWLALLVTLVLGVLIGMALSTRQRRR